MAFAYDELIPFKNSLNHDGNSCDENCLMLNLFTPECNKNAKLPVRSALSGKNVFSVCCSWTLRSKKE